MDKSPDEPEAVTGLIDAARNYLARALGAQATGAELDGPETSLAYVDHYIREATAKGPLKPEVLALVAAALGAYFGRVAVSVLGGTWSLTRGADPAGFRIQIEPGSLRFFPVGMAASALVRGEAPGYDDSFTADAKWMGALEEALASVAPVEEEYFYSLTGRLETLAHALEILGELMRKERERN